jgi:hypothetical protein
LCAGTLQRDPRAYDEPDAYRPERWSSDAVDSAFLTFGGGGRRCLGEHLARIAPDGAGGRRAAAQAAAAAYGANRRR